MKILLALLWLPAVLAQLLVSDPPCDPEITIQEAEANRDIIESYYDMFQNFAGCEEHGQKKQDGSDNRGQSPLIYHTVCRQPGAPGNKMLVVAKIELKDMDNGKPAIESVRKNLKKHHALCLTDESGHIVGRETGGTGHEFNLFVQSQQLNQNHRKSAMAPIPVFLKLERNEQHLRNLQLAREALTGIAETPIQVHHRHVLLDVAFSYGQKPVRPERIVYIIRMYEDGALVKAIHGFFYNKNYADSELFACPGNNVDVVMFVHPSNIKFTARQTCNVNAEYRYLNDL